MLGDVARQPERLVRESRQPGPATAVRAPTQGAREVAFDGVPKAIGAPSDALDLARRQPQGLAQLTDRAARAKAREGRDERRAVVAVAFVESAEQDLAHLRRKGDVAI